MEGRLGRTSAAVAVLLMVVALISVGHAQETTNSPAQTEGKVVIYTAQGADLVEALAADFEKRNPGIDAEVFHLTGAPLAERFYADASRGQVVADVITNGAPEMQEFGEAGLLAPYTNDDFKAHVTEERLGLEPYGYIDQFASGAVVYNTSKVSPEEIATINNWTDLADPKWKGRIVLVDPNMTSSHFQYYVGLYSAMGEKAFDDWLATLAKNNPTILNSNTPSVDGILRGEFDIGIITEGNPLRRMKVEGGPPLGIKYVSPTPAQFSSTALVKNAPHPQAAKLFLDYLYGKDGQELWMKLDASRSARDDAVSPNSDLPGYVKSTDLKLVTWDDFKKPGSMREAMLAIWNKDMKK